MAIQKGREELAREALFEKRRFRNDVEGLERQAGQYTEIIERFQSDIEQLENKLEAVRKKHAILVARHLHATKRKAAQTKIRHADTSDVFARFESFENRIERMEADADLINFGRKRTLRDELDDLERDDEIESEIEELKKVISQSNQESKE